MFKTASHNCAKIFLLLSLFVVFFSTALLNIFASLLLLFFILAAIADRNLLKPLKTPPAIIALLLYAALMIGLAWSVAPQQEAFQAISKYRKLLFLPIAICLAWNDQQLIRRSFYACIAGVGVLTIACYLVWFDLMPFKSFSWWRMGTSDNAWAFKSYITIGILLGFTSVACWAYYLYATTLRMRIASIVGGAFFAFPVLFLMWGRTGYVVMLCTTLALLLLRFRSNWKILLCSIGLLLLLAFGIYSVSDIAKMRSNHLAAEISDYQKTEELNSSGIRLSFYKAGWHMFVAHPIIGTGPGSFAENFARIDQSPGPLGAILRANRAQPHSDVVLMAIQLGLIGLALYGALLASLALVFRKRPSYYSDLLWLLCVSFAVPACFNSLMWDVTEGHWFVLMAGCLYAATHKYASDAATAVK